GEVRYPGPTVLTPSTMTVPEALAAVGSPTVDAGDSVVVIRAAKNGYVAERRIIAIKDLDQGTAGVDISLEDGDIVNVPLGNRFYISGFVKNPGTYRLALGTTVSQAIVLAGGLTDHGVDRRVRVGRLVK